MWWVDCVRMDHRVACFGPGREGEAGGRRGTDEIDEGKGPHPTDTPFHCPRRLRPFPAFVRRLYSSNAWNIIRIFDLSVIYVDRE